MTARRPLVVITGTAQELPAADTAGPFVLPTATQTASVSALPGQQIPLDTTSATPIVVTLPLAPGNGTTIEVGWILGANATATVVTGGGSDTFQGGGTVSTLAMLYQFRIYSYRTSGALWLVKNSPPISGLDARYKALLSPASVLTPTTGAVTLDFAANNDGLWLHTLTGDPTYSTSNLALGRQTTLYISAGGADRVLVFPAAWTWIGPRPPITLPSGRQATVQTFSTSTADGGVAAWWTGPAGKRTLPITSSATPTINTDLCDTVDITALATAITSMTTNLSGTPGNFQTLVFRIKDNGTARAITWGASFVNRGGTLPTTTVLGKITYVALMYNLTAAVWDCVGTSQEP